MTSRYYRFEAWNPNTSKVVSHKLHCSTEADEFDPILAGFVYDQGWRELSEKIGPAMERFHFVGSYTYDFITGNELLDPESEGLFNDQQEEA